MILLLGLLLLQVLNGFYIPGVAPRTFRYGDRVELKVNKLTSIHTQIPLDYYSAKFCRPYDGVQQASENLGEFLTGDRIENSPYELYMEQDQFCKVLCQVELKTNDVAHIKKIIKEEYHHNWIIDNLPAASIVDSKQYIITAYAGGFPVGYQDHKATYIFNHVNIIVEYHPLDDGSRVVGFYVEPFTVKHRFAANSGIDGEKKKKKKM
uniref:Transmembrane 9 superfamily member n=1 Tax=Aureoumbra lagunensis TaxID=44058 RepID=A0A7S3JWL9_9STRA